jgi:hypothetical protein
MRDSLFSTLASLVGSSNIRLVGFSTFGFDAYQSQRRCARSTLYLQSISMLVEQKRDVADAEMDDTDVG